MVRVEIGSIFDSKCDLLVVPCNSRGGVTTSVFSDLKSHALPTLVGSIPFGGVYFRDVHNYKNAAALAYAASVDFDSDKSNSNAISRLAKEIRRYCQQNGMLSVNLPLLGSGAGGLSSIESFTALRGELETDANTVYKIFCYTREVYQNVAAAEPTLDIHIERPRVFISYAGNDPKNAAWVKALATGLIQNGVNARLDVFI